MLGSYASFLWDAEEDEDVGEVATPAAAVVKEETSTVVASCDSPALVPAC